MLCNLIHKICSSSISVIADDMVGTILEALHNYLLNRGEDHDSLPKFMESSDHKFEVLKSTGFTFATDLIRDSYLTELRDRKQENSTLYQELLGWKSAPNTEAGEKIKEQGRKALNDAFRARVCIKRSGKDYKQFRRDLSNRYISRS